MRQHDLAELFRVKAQQDLRALSVLASDREIADETVGFHAQQAVEKALKAVLTAAGVRFGRTHDLDQLLELVRQSGFEEEDWFDEVTVFGPYAVLGRYVELDPDEPVDRQAAVPLVERVLDWTGRRLEESSSA